MAVRALLVVGLIAAWMPGTVEAQADDGVAGAFLAARSAIMDDSFADQVTYLSRVDAADPDNPFVLENLVQALVATGDMARAADIARRMQVLGLPSQTAGLVLQAWSFHQDTPGAVLDPDAMETGPLTDRLAEAWAHLALGRMSDALDRLDALAETPGLAPFAHYHRALMLALAGDFETAAAIFGVEGDGAVGLTRRGIVAHLMILGQLEEFDAALELADRFFSPDAEDDIQSLRAAFEAGNSVPFDAVTGATDGMAEAYFVLASALQGEEQGVLPLIYARLAAFLRPDHADAILLTGGLLEQLQQYELADAAYDQVSKQSAFYLQARLGRAQALFRSGDSDAAILTLRALADERPDALGVHSTLGDFLRREERFAEAVDAYSRAVDLLGEPEPRHWVLFYTRAISYERQGDWEPAERDFRRALELDPDQPQVLNYLGYSLVEQRRNLDEALDMIERAVAAEPESGYIVDSLGWVLYRLGRFDEALPVMERAVELMPTDPILNDHLGDVYWMVGRKREAAFQWRRALSFAPHPDLETERIRMKLDIGLDAVLEQEDGSAHP